jgi:hypothetical protein
MNPFAAIASPIEPPAWSGPVLVHRLLDEAEEDEDQAAAVAIAKGRICTHCGGAFPPTGEFFYRSKGARDGFRPECKKCTPNFQPTRSDGPGRGALSSPRTGVRSRNCSGALQKRSCWRARPGR